LQLAVHAALGVPLFGLKTEQSKTLFFSAEDDDRTIRRRVAAICRTADLDPVEVHKNLIVIDATDVPCLFEEKNFNGVRRGDETDIYDYLKVLAHGELIKFLIIDNASDTYGANPIDRQQVTKYIRSLVRAVGSSNGAVLLLAHVNKQTSKAGKNQTNTESYADSAAWHNAARSRLFLNVIDNDGTLLLEHLKNNFDKTQPEIRLAFNESGSSLYVPDAFDNDSNGAIKSATKQDNIMAILALIREYYSREEWISPSHNSSKNAHATLKHESTYPFDNERKGRGECVSLLRDCQREKLLINEKYTYASRKCERWALTEKATELLKWPSIVRDEVDG
jgi:RecA-family ATPase